MGWKKNIVGGYTRKRGAKNPIGVRDGVYLPKGKIGDIIEQGVRRGDPGVKHHTGKLTW
jgi:hypothetical protein